MFSSQILDVAIGLVFLYFLFSLLCSVIIEAVAALTQKRPRMLKEGLSALLRDEKVLEKLYKQPLFLGNTTPETMGASLWESIKALWPWRQRVSMPSYISPRSFVLSLLESLKQQDGVKNHFSAGIPDIDSPENIKKLVEALPQGSAVRGALLPLLETAGTGAGALEKALGSMEKWYDEAMERVTGWYKRYSQSFALLLAFLVALALNADTFAISKALYRDPALRNAVAAVAVDQVTKIKPTEEPKSEAAKPEGRQTPIPKPKQAEKAAGSASTPAQPKPKGRALKGAKPHPPSPAPTQSSGQGKGASPPDSGGAGAGSPTREKPAKGPAAGSSEDKSLKEYRELKEQIQKMEALNLPLGWGKWVAENKKDLVGIYNPEKDQITSYFRLGWVILKNFLCNPLNFLGIIFTAMMVSLGSNFWFELLNKLVNMRNAGKKPLGREEQEAKKP